jgi:hypothetical protein
MAATSSDAIASGTVTGGESIDVSRGAFTIVVMVCLVAVPRGKCSQRKEPPLVILRN